MSKGKSPGKTLIVYYSRSGSTKKICEELHSRYPDSTDLAEIRDLKPPGLLTIFFRMLPKSAKRLPTPIQKMTLDMSRYDRIVLASPIWAGIIPSPVYAFFQQHPVKGKSAAGIAVSSSGKPHYSEAVRMALSNAGASCLEACSVTPQSVPAITLG